MAKTKTSFTSDTAKKAGANSIRKPLDQAWRDKLEEYKKSKNTSLLDEIFQVLEDKAKEGNLKAIDMLLDRSHGKAKQDVNITGNMANVNVEVNKKDLKKVLSDLQSEC